MEREWEDWEDIAANSFQELGAQVAEILPDLVGAIVVLVIGLFIAGTLGKLIYRLLRATGVDGLVRSTALGQKMSGTPNMRFSPSRMMGWLVKWFFILVTLITVSNILDLHQINEFLHQVVLYIPNVIIAVAILMIGFIAAEFVSNLISAALGRSPLEAHEQRFLATAAKAAITVFAVMAALIQLRIAEDLIRTLFAGIVFALSLALGLAFGLGGREQAARFIERQANRATSPTSGSQPFDAMRQ